MPSGRPHKKLNENFFDKESKAMRYVLGLAYQCYLPQPNHGILFRSPYEDLVQIIKNQLESGHNILSGPIKSTHWIETTNRPYLHSRLQELDLNLPKKERKFPENIDEDFINHFVRGFTDAKAGIGIYDNRGYIEIRFNNLFLIGLHQVLAEYAGIQRAEPRGDKIKYAQKDSSKIHDFIYQDWEYIQKHGLYLPSKKELIENYLVDGPVHFSTIACSKRIKKAQELLLQGMLHEKIAGQLGYSMAGFYVAFRGQTGMTPRQWTKQNA